MNGYMSLGVLIVNTLILVVGVLGLRKGVKKTHVMVDSEKKALLHEIVMLKQEIVTLKKNLLEKHR